MSQVTVLIPCMLETDSGKAEVKCEISSVYKGGIAEVEFWIPNLGRLVLTPPHARAMGYSLQVAAQEVWK